MIPKVMEELKMLLAVEMPMAKVLQHNLLSTKMVVLFNVLTSIKLLITLVLAILGIMRNMGLLKTAEMI